jgi:hypothetical protein
METSYRHLVRENDEQMNKEKPANEKSPALARKDAVIAISDAGAIDEAALFECVAEIIESRKARVGIYANREVTLMYWEVGQYIGSVVLGGGRGA